MKAITESTKFIPPKTEDGEIYIGTIIKVDGTGHHIILLDGDNDNAKFNDAMKWAKSLKGDLPDRAEQALLFRDHKDLFKPDCYWSSTLHAEYSDYAWFQSFDSGGQDDYNRSGKCRSRAVRRLAI